MAGFLSVDAPLFFGNNPDCVGSALIDDNQRQPPVAAFNDDARIVSVYDTMQHCDLCVAHGVLIFLRKTYIRHDSSITWPVQSKC